MRSKLSPGIGSILLSLALVLGGSFRASHAAPMVSIIGLEVNSASRACGSTTPVTPNSTVCVLFTTSESGFAEAFLDNVRFCAGNVFPRSTPWRCCFTFSSTPIQGTRTIRVRVTNSTTGTGLSNACTLVVGSGTQNQLTGTIRTNKNQGGACNPNVTYFLGEQISFIVTSSLSARAIVTLTKPGGSPLVIFDGNVSAGSTPVASGTVGSPTGQRTLNLTLIKSGFPNATDTCGFNAEATGFAPGSTGGNR